MTTKAREALQAVVDCALDGRLQITETAFEKVLDALKEPVRNCEVGTPKEQTLRFYQFCNSYSSSCKGCPCKDIPAECRLVWAQMPYESEVTDETIKA